MKTGYKINREKTFHLILVFYLIQEVFLTKTNIDSLIGSTYTNYLSWFFRILLIACAIVKLFKYDKFSSKTIVILFLVLVFLSLSSYFSHTTAMFFSIFVIMCSYGTDFEKSVKVDYYTISCILIITVFLSLSGLIRSSTTTRTVLDTTRNSLGFNHPNSLGMIAFLWIAEHIYKNRGKGLRSIWLPIIVSVIVFLITYSFTAVIMMVILVVQAFFVEVFEKRIRLSKKQIRFLIISLFIILIGLVLYFWRNISLFTKELWTLRARFTLSQKYLNAYGISLIGQQISIGANVYIAGYGNTYGYLDNGIIRLFIENGVIFSVIYFSLYIKSIRKMVISKNILLLFLSVDFLVYSFMENDALLLAYNIFLIKNLDFYNMRRRTHYRVIKRHSGYFVG